VYLTEHGEGEPQQAAIKFIPADPATAEDHLCRWAQAAALSHPHLIRIFQMGRCELDRVELLYAVMEYAPEDLSQVLPERALGPQEAREILDPVLDALAYLHGQGFVHGRVKPSNILAVNDRLKISSDGLRLIGESSSGAGERSAYDPPEISRGEISAASDVWSLGMTLAEVLTQYLPVWDEHEPGEPELPASIPEPFRAIVRHCLRRDPQRRWTVAEIAAGLRQPAPAAAVQPPPRIPPKRSPTKWRGLVPAAVGVLAFAAVLAVPRLFQRPADAPQSSSAAERQGVQGEPGEVVNRVLPAVPQRARDTIRGTIRVGVRVRVDPSGNVSQAALDSAGPSRYFANLALQAARRWKFAPAKPDGRDALSDWILRFEFTQETTRAFPALASP